MSQRFAQIATGFALQEQRCVWTNVPCKDCGLPLVHGGTVQTLIGYGEMQDGHDHDDNCRGREYVCFHGHGFFVSRRNSCPVCDWRGKTDCSICGGNPKADKWPEEGSTETGLSARS